MDSGINTSDIIYLALGNYGNDGATFFNYVVQI